MMAGERIWLAGSRRLGVGRRGSGRRDESFRSEQRRLRFCVATRRAAFAGASWSQAARACGHRWTWTRARGAANARETWETTTRAAAAWCARARRRLPRAASRCFRAWSRLADFRRKDEPFFASPPRDAPRFVPARAPRRDILRRRRSEPGLADVVGACCVGPPRSRRRVLRRTRSRGGGSRRAWRRRRRAEATVAVGVAALARRLAAERSAVRVLGQSVSSDCASVSSAGARGEA